MSVQVLVSQKGPLPITINFKAPGDFTCYLEVNGSVWTATPGRMLGIQVQFDGKILGQANIFANAGSTHIGVVPAYFPLTLKYGVSHALVLSAAPGGTVSDLNDFFTAVLHY